MTINKKLELHVLISWFAFGCLAIVCTVGIGHFLLWSYLRFQKLLELPCG